MPPSDSDKTPPNREAAEDFDAVLDVEANNATTTANSSSAVEISDIEPSSSSEESTETDFKFDDNSSMEADDEPDFRPFNRDPKYPHEVKIYFGTLGALLLAAHLGYISVWWVFAVPIGLMLPEELQKIRKYGLETYLNALHFKRPTLRDMGLVVGGLALIIVFLSSLGVGVLTADAFISEAGESMLVGSDGSPPDGGHLLTEAVMTWWIYGVGVLIMFLVVGPAEELMFRHNLQSFLKKRVSTTRAIIGTNVIFALMHLPVIIFVPNLLWMFLPLFGIFLLGTVFSLQYEQTDNLFVPSVTHSIWNSFVLTLLLIGV